MKWILFRLTSIDSVVYNTSEDDHLVSLPYKDFLKYLWDSATNYLIEDTKGLLQELNSYEVVHVNLENGKWEIVEEDATDRKEPSFNELYELNKEDVKTKSMSPLDRDGRNNLRQYKNDMFKRLKIHD